MSEEDELLKKTWQNVIERIYHEDNLLSQRTYNFSTVQAFLVAALAFSSSNPGKQNLAYVVAIFGLGLSLFFVPLGLRNSNAIAFWREYLKYLESKGVPAVDSTLFKYYRNGKTSIVGGGEIGLGTERKSPRPVYGLFPWCFADEDHLPWLRSVNILVGVGIPVLSTLFWVSILLTLFIDILTIRLKIIVGGSALFSSSYFVFSFFTGRLIPTKPKIIENARKGVAPESPSPPEGRA